MSQRWSRVVVGSLLVLLGAPAAAEEGAALVFHWQPLPGATAYDIEIAEDRGFARVVIRATVPGTDYRWHTLTRRPYYWRVRGVDADGRKGVFSAPRVIGAVVATPRPLGPPAGHRAGHGSTPPTVRLRWERGGEALARYDLQVARDPGFTDLVLTRRVGGTEAAFRPPQPGRYYWRVGGVDLRGQVVAPGDVRDFTVYVEAPRATTPTEGAAVAWGERGGVVRLGWQPRPVRGYQVQVAADPGFKQLVVRARAAGTAADVAVPARAGYFWRVRGLDPETGWSPRASFQVTLAAPAPLAPADGAVVGAPSDTGAVELSWRPVAGAVAYLVAVASLAVPASAAAPPPATAPPVAPPASRPVAAPRRVAGTRIGWSARSPGAYAWSVRAVDEAGVASPASEPRRFEVAARPATVGTAPSGFAGGTVGVRPAGGRVGRSLEIGARVGVFHNLGDVTTARAAVQVRARLPLLRRRLGVALAVGYYTATSGAPAADGAPAVGSRLHGVPLELVAFYLQPLGAVDGYLGVGLDVSVLRARVSVATQPTWARSGVEVGGLALLGVERGVGPGRVYAELAFELATRSTGLVAMDPGGLTGSLGYRVRVW